MITKLVCHIESDDNLDEELLYLLYSIIRKNQMVIKSIRLLEKGGVFIKGQDITTVQPRGFSVLCEKQIRHYGIDQIKWIEIDSEKQV